jgi:hypothetical protein
VPPRSFDRAQWFLNLPLSLRLNRDNLGLQPLMERIHLCPKPLGSSTEWAVSYMRVTLCRGRVGVTEKAPDDLKAEATRNKVGRVGVAIHAADNRQFPPAR